MSKFSFLTRELLQREYDELGSVPAIARKYNITVGSTKYYCKKLGVKVDKFYKSKYTINEDIFSEENEISFYLAGFMAADGNISYDPRGSTASLNLGLAKIDEPHLLKIKDAMSFSGPVINCSSWDKIYNKRNYSSKLSIYCSRKIIKDLETNFGVMPAKSLIYRFPVRILNNPLVRHFIRGYFDGDGCFSADKRDDGICFELLGTEDFLKNVEKILQRDCDLIAPLKVSPTKNIYRVRTRALQSVTSIVNFLYGSSNFHLDRKFDIIKHLIE